MLQSHKVTWEAWESSDGHSSAWISLGFVYGQFTDKRFCKMMDEVLTSWVHTSAPIYLSYHEKSMTSSTCLCFSHSSSLTYWWHRLQVHNMQAHTHTHTHTHLSDGCKVEDSCSHTGEREPLWHLADISFCWQSVEEPFFFSHLYNIDQGSTTGNMSVLINVSLLNWNDQSLTRGQCCICKHICLDTLTFHVHPEWDLIKHVL